MFPPLQADLWLRTATAALPCRPRLADSPLPRTIRSCSSASAPGPTAPSPDLGSFKQDCASPTSAHYHTGERPAARACAAGLALLTVRAAAGAAKVDWCRETA